MIGFLVSKDSLPDIIEEFQLLVGICLEHNVCCSQNKTYKYFDGLPMGGPLSSIVTDVFINHLKSTLLSSAPGHEYIQFWARYVDKVLCV